MARSSTQRGRPKLSLSNATRGVQDKPDRILLHGVPNIGKTTWAAGSPSPIFLDLAEGSTNLDVARFTFENGTPKADEWEEVMEALRMLANEEHDYKTVVIDELSALERLLHRKVLTDNSWSPGEGAEWGRLDRASLAHWDELLAKCDDLVRVGIEVILVCHTKIKSYDPPGTPPYERYVPMLGGKDTEPKIVGWSDLVLFALEDVVVRKNKDGKGEAQARGAVRLLHTVRCPLWEAKQRGYLPAQLPLDYGEFRKARQAGQDPEVVKRQLLEVAEDVCDEDEMEKLTNWLGSEGLTVLGMARMLNTLTVRREELALDEEGD